LVDEDKPPLLGSEDNPFNIKEVGVDIKSLMTVAKLLSSDHESIKTLTVNDVKQCDKFVKKLCLDKYRATYFHRSR
jgi:hypothetical protein